MAKSTLDIIIKTIKQGGGDKDTVKGLVGVKNAVSQAGVAFAALAGAAYAIDKVLEATVGTFVDYADKVRTVQYMTGATAEESSRLIQVADDMKISYESLSKIMTAAVKNGIEPNIASIAALSDQYLALAPGAERAKFLLDNFGKSGGEMAELMSKGSDAIRDMSEALDGGLILDDKALKSAREYEMAIDELSDSFESLKVSAGVEIAPFLTDGVKIINANIEALSGFSQAMKDISDGSLKLNDWAAGIINDNKIGALKDAENAALDQARAVEILAEKYRDAYFISNDMKDAALAQATAEREAAEATDEHADAMSNVSTAAQELEVNYGNLLDMTMNLQDGFDKFAEKEAEIKAKMDEVNAAFATGAMTAAEHDQKLAELSGQLQQNAAAMEDWSKRTVFALVQARLAAEGGIDANEFALLIGLGEQMGIIDQKTASMAQSLNEKLNAIDTSGGQEAVDDFANEWQNLLSMPHEQTFTVTTVEETVTSDSTSSSTTSTSCFLAGTSITLGNGDRREIQDVLSGDLVLTMDPETGATMQARVGRVFLHESDHYYALRLSNGKTLRVTSEHPLWVIFHPQEDGDWVKVRDLEAGWSLRAMENGVAIATIRRVEGRAPVYNLHVDHAWHTYFADGVLAHNKATGGVVRAPGSGLQDTVMVPLAAGEGILNQRAMQQPGVAELLHALNAGQMSSGRGGSGRQIIIYNLTIKADGNVVDVLDSLSD